MSEILREVFFLYLVLVRSLQTFHRFLFAIPIQVCDRSHGLLLLTLLCVRF